MAKSLLVRPISIKTANAFIKDHHRHHRPTIRNSGKWALSALNTDGRVVGVVIAGNPVSASLMDGLTIEVTRLCVAEHAPKGTCSLLLSKCCRIWRVMGGERVITYTLDHESGASLRGAGWVHVGDVMPHNRWLNKVKTDGLERSSLAIYSLKKKRWQKLVGS